jgi:hypothetical protein
LSKKYNITACLRKSKKLTGADTFYAVANREAPILMDEICTDAAKVKGNTLDAATLEKSVKLVLKKVLNEVLGGSVVDMGDFSVELSVRGEFGSSDDKYDKSRHRLSLKIIPKEVLIKEFSKVKVEILSGEKTCRIHWIRNKRTNNLDGMFKAGDSLIVEGCGLLPAGESGKVGVYLIGAERECEKKFIKEDFESESPEKLVIKIPENLLCGRYFVKVVTQYDGSEGKAVDKISEAVSERALCIDGEDWYN